MGTAEVDAAPPPPARGSLQMQGAYTPSPPPPALLGLSACSLISLCLRHSPTPVPSPVIVWGFV